MARSNEAGKNHPKNMSQYQQVFVSLAVASEFLSHPSLPPIFLYLYTFTLTIHLALFSLSRVVWVFGGVVDGPIDEVTPTYLSQGVLSTLRQADCIADQVLTRHSKSLCVFSTATSSSSAHSLSLSLSLSSSLLPSPYRSPSMFESNAHCSNTHPL